MKKLICILAISAIAVLAGNQPMEAITNYNVIMVHGASDAKNGLTKCSEMVDDAYKFAIEHGHEKICDKEYLGGLAINSMGQYWNNYTCSGEYDGYNLTYWLDSLIFEDRSIDSNGNWTLNEENLFSSPYIYAQRSFINPAESPAINANELGNPTWMGCNVRRSLIEEAQEVKAEGRDTLQRWRKNGNYDSLPPTRNILIAHSMGGVISREYVQGDGYNEDVDKVITLDSPHGGVRSLDFLVSMHDWTNTGIYSSMAFVEMEMASILLAGLTNDPISTGIALFLKILGFANLGQGVLAIGTDIGLQSMFGYKESDPMVTYINPDNTDAGINVLKHKEFNPNHQQPMFRLVHATRGLTASSPKTGGMQMTTKLLVTDVLRVPLMNAWAQILNDNPFEIQYAEVMTAMMAGLAGFWLTENGSIIVPDWSSKGQDVSFLNDERLDVKRYPYDGAFNTAQMPPERSSVLVSAAMIAIPMVGVSLSWNPSLSLPIKIAMVTSVALVVGAEIFETIYPVALDFIDSHAQPVMSKYQSKWNGPSNTYSQVQGDTATVIPYLMEDFLYEKPFVNLALFVSDSTKRTVDAKCYYEQNKNDPEALCEIGLYGEKGSLKKEHYTYFQKNSLDLKSRANWSKMGMKVDRWERVDGLDSNGNITPKLVPIRHVERYNVPTITVDNWIEKYSFVVDDLMPHRLRQIKMSFNYQEEIAWECDIMKDPDEDDVCEVYKRTSGGEWTKLRSEKHPVKKDGTFSFEATKYYDNLLSIQKDNQNTVTISTVNKIGLSNTQRFYYLFKATDNMLEPIWPTLDVVLNNVNDFEAYASVLDYQGFRVVGAYDAIFKDGEQNKIMYNEMEVMLQGNRDATFKSKISTDSLNLKTGEYIWRFKTAIVDSSTGTEKPDTSDIYNIRFIVDKTPPIFDITSSSVQNPDSNLFAARFSWNDTINDPDIRIMRWTLERENSNNNDSMGTFTYIGEFPALYDIISKDFAVAWSDLNTTNTLNDGFYRVKAYAVDFAVPNKVMYDSLNRFVANIAAGKKYPSDSEWKIVNDINLNHSTEYAYLRIDRTAPILSINKSGAVDAGTGGIYEKLVRPSRDVNYTYVSEDSLLSISYSVTENLSGRDSTPVTIGWDFIHALDTTIVDRAGDSIWIEDKISNSVIGTWTEMQSIKLSDGDYNISASVRDDAKNAAVYSNLAKVRIDRNSPNIKSLVSNKLVYADSSKNYGATIKVSENNDVVTNRTGMNCYYSVQGLDADTSWQPILRKDNSSLLHTDSIEFVIPVNIVGNMNGKRYLTAVCLDAAGNASTKTDLFHIGDRYPSIVSPNSNDYLKSPVVAISGIAPPSMKSEKAIYRLRYRFDADSSWHTEGISVVSANQSDSFAYLSKTSQSNEGILGYLQREALEDTVLFIELGVKSCDSCKWVTDSVEITLGTLDPSTDYPNVVFEPSNNSSIVAGKESLDVSLRLEGAFDDNYQIRLYAEDSKGKGLFEKSLNGVKQNPFYGEPRDTTKSKGVWFYEYKGKYHLQWNGLSNTDTLNVAYDSKNFENTCMGANGEHFLACRIDKNPFVGIDLDINRINSTLGSDLGAFSEILPLSVTDSIMSLFSEKGHIVFESEGAFHISRNNIFSINDSSKTDFIPVYFGNSDKDGFTWINISSETLDALKNGWTVDPKNYGIHFKWNGMASSGSFPSEGKVKIYSEVITNNPDKLYARLDTITVNVKLPDLEISLPSKLSDFIILKNDTATASCDTCERRIFQLTYMDIPYSIKYRDAYVTIVIKNSKGNVVDTLVSSALQNASARDSAYHVRWNGKNSLGTTETNAGIYTVEISAKDVSENIVTKSSSFNVKYTESMRDMSNSKSIYISEAWKDSSIGDKYRYEPVADYLIDAKLSGWTLSDSIVKNGVHVSGTFSGTQNIIGYEPKRFSLGIKRHRENLDLVVVRRVEREIEYIDCWMFFNIKCWETGQKTKISYYVDTVHFSSSNLSQELITHTVANEEDEKYGYNDTYSKNYFDMVVFSLAGWESVKKETKDITDTSIWFATIKGRSEVIWSLEDITGNTKGFFIPPPSSNISSHSYLSDTLDVGCEPKYDENNILTESCSYNGNESETTEGYNPNKKLFNVTFSAIEDGKYYAVYDRPNPSSKTFHGDSFKRYRYIYFNIKLTIPDTAYWNAPFGMDNLVNRTIRFDHTNKTIYSNDNKGYWSAIENNDINNSLKGCAFFGTYFDGSNWQTNRSYGLLTPFEMQCLPFLPANVLPGGKNIFLFPDENATHMYPSYFDLKFYGVQDSSDYYQVLALGVAAASDSSKCDPIISNYDAAYWSLDTSKPKYFRCQTSLTSLDSVGVKRTPLLHHVNVDFYVGRNQLWSNNMNAHKQTITYPASLNWRSEIMDSCSNKMDYTDLLNGNSHCYKYYDVGSKIQYQVNDKFDSLWSILMTKNGIIKNNVNSPAAFWPPNLISSTLIDLTREMGSKEIPSDFTLYADTNNFVIRQDKFGVDRGAFFLILDSLEKIGNVLKSGDVERKLTISNPDSSKMTLSDTKDTLYIHADQWKNSSIYRRIDDTTAKLPERPNRSTLFTSKIFLNKNEWIKNIAVDSAKLFHLDTTDHSHLEVTGSFPAAREFYISYKDSIKTKRPKELVEIRAKLNADKVYRLSYLNDSSYFVLLDSIKVNENGDYRLQWFNVNKLQGNTQFLLTWGGNDANLYCSAFDLIIGSQVNKASTNTIQSLFGDLSVTFPKNALFENKDVTVRTVDASDYHFNVFNDMVITGPIMEVLPHMTFEKDTALPRIQMKISKAEMDAMQVTPQTLRLYKVDFENEKLVPLTNALYGYLNADGSPAVQNGTDSATCKYPLDYACYPGNEKWEYILISAETKTFSVFVALDYARAETNDYTVEFLPKIATENGRDVRVKGINAFNMYVDNDSLLRDSLDITPAILVSAMKDTNDIIHIENLPWKNADSIDSVWAFIQPKTNDTTISFAVPKSAIAIRVPNEFNCYIGSDSLWLGLDNGYMFYDVSCTHPGHGFMNLYRSGKTVVEINTATHTPIYYDGYNGLNKIQDGIYESRYVGTSVLGSQVQIAGPIVYTDSARPVIDNLKIEKTYDVLAHVYDITAVVTDKKSGINYAKVTTTFGNDTTFTQNLIPDSTGKVQTSIRLSRKKVSDCTGCRLTINVYVEDLGHNYTDTLWRSEPLFPYPNELALWYQALEGFGKIAYEFTGTGHDLNLYMLSPWLSASGLYFYNPIDRAVGKGNVDLGTSSEYSLEARIRLGNTQDTLWRRILGFVGTSGLNIELQNQGKNLRLVEGSKKWILRGYLPAAKWSNVVVTVDSTNVRFYIDGVMIKRMVSTPMEREFYGTFSMGEHSTNSFIGHISDIRLYTKALNDEEILALTQPITDENDSSEIHTIIVLGSEMQGEDKQFSCAVSGYNYFIGNKTTNKLNISAYIPSSDDYKVILYARSANHNNADIKVAVNETTMQSGYIQLEKTWRPLEVTGVKLIMNAGIQNITLNIPEGVEVAGVAFTNGDMIKPAHISWKSSSINGLGNPSSESSFEQKVHTSIRFEGYPLDKSMLRPRIQLKNISNEVLTGFKIRYYFRGEEPNQVHVSAFYPANDTLGLAVYSESFNTGYVEWAFDTTRILSGSFPYFGEGPLMGIYNTGYVPWYAEDDPSYVPQLTSDVNAYTDNFGLVVLDTDNNLVGGSCVEMEDPIEALPPSVRVLAADVHDDTLTASEIQLKLENLGSISLKNYDMRYYFYVEEGLQPILEIYHSPSFVQNIEMRSLGKGRYEVNIHVEDTPLTPHTVWPNEVKFALHLHNWERIWMPTDDPSHKNLSKTYAPSFGICVFDSTNMKIYGEDPIWPTPNVIKETSDSTNVPDYGYNSDNVPVIRTEDGLLIILDGYPYVQLDLVYANGIPIRSIFAGTVMPGEQFIFVDWSDIDLNHTYLVMRKNSKIISTKLLNNL